MQPKPSTAKIRIAAAEAITPMAPTPSDCPRVRGTRVPCSTADSIPFTKGRPMNKPQP
jgi:hypothetical protein